MICHIYITRDDRTVGASGGLWRGRGGFQACWCSCVSARSVEGCKSRVGFKGVGRAVALVVGGGARESAMVRGGARLTPRQLRARTRLGGGGIVRFGGIQ